MNFRIAGALGALALVVAELTATVAPSQALGNPVGIRSAGVTQISSNHVVAGGTFIFQTPEGNDPPANYTAHIDVYSCGSFIHSGDVAFSEHPGVVIWFSPDGESDFLPNSVNSRIGPSIQYTAIITQPDGGTYAINGEVNGLAKRPSCDQILSGGGSNNSSSHEVVVKKWGRVVGAPRVNHKVTVMKPKGTSGEKVQYKWIANGHTVSTSRTIRVPVKIDGKNLISKTTVSKNGKSKTHIVNVGRVRR